MPKLLPARPCVLFFPNFFLNILSTNFLIFFSINSMLGPAAAQQWTFLNFKKISFFLNNSNSLLGTAENMNMFSLLTSLNSSFTKKNKNLNLSVLSKYFEHRLYQFFNKKTKIINVNYASYYIPYDIKSVSTGLLSAYSFLRKSRVVARLLSLLLIFFQYKDISPIMVFIRTIFEYVHFKKHKVYFNLFNSIFTVLSIDLLRAFNVLGVDLIFKGKLAVGGNAKKRTQRYSIGVRSNSTKFLKVVYARSQYRTSTGVVGFYLSLFY